MVRMSERGYSQVASEGTSISPFHYPERAAVTPTPYAPPADTSAAEPRPPNRFLAAFLALVATGLGHVYAGHTGRGLAWAVAAPLIGIGWLASLERLHLGGWFLLLALVGAAPWVASMIDAGRVASRPGARRAGVLLVTFVGFGLFVFGRGTALLARRFVLEAFKIPSGSMMPALLVGDHIFVDKMSWTPHRGDIIVFPFPEHPDQDFVKRVVGLPGDRVEFDTGVPIINGVRTPSCRVGTATMGDGDRQFSGDVFVETLDGHPYLAFYDKAVGAFATAQQGPWTVEAGEVFVVGDNRFNAHDSRMWFGGQGGGVPIASVHGAAFIVWMSDAGDHRTGLSLDVPHLPTSMASLQPDLDRCLTALQAR